MDGGHGGSPATRASTGTTAVSERSDARVMRQPERQSLRFDGRTLRPSA